MLQGIFPVLPTCFSSEKALDPDAQQKVIQFALEAGCHGLVFPGVASEYSFLTPDERGQLLDQLAGTVAGRVPIVGGASAGTVDEVVEAGTMATACGMNHLMIMAPGQFGEDARAHQQFFAQITAALPEAQIILQNAPSPIGAGLGADAILTLVNSNQSITYIKEETLPSGPAISAFLDRKPSHLKGVFGGGGSRFIIDELDRGACGAMPAVELTDLHVALYQAHSQGNRSRARELYRLSLPLLVSQAIYRMGLTKYTLARRGIADAQTLRAELPALDARARRDIDEMLDELLQSFPCP
ncbi:MAG: dihydrodipicolinate synthase family protein [Verrucomicrobiota bacterium]